MNISLPLILALVASAVACSSSRAGLPPIATVEHVDLERFMGDWYVIASIPTRFERGAHNAVESYELAGDRKIRTTFTFRKGSFDGDERTFRPTGFVRDDGSNASWGMRFIWPFRSDYRIIHVDPGYRTTIIGREKRDFVWIMARTPTLDDDEYQRLLEMAARQGYDVARIVEVPQRWE